MISLKPNGLAKQVRQAFGERSPIVYFESEDELILISLRGERLVNYRIEFDPAQSRLERGLYVNELLEKLQRSRRKVLPLDRTPFAFKRAFVKMRNERLFHA